MITHNRCQEALHSLARLQSDPAQPRIIVVDNGSCDDTVKCINERHPQVTVVKAGANLGAAGRTLGVQLADTPYVALADDDTWWRAGDLQRAADSFEACPRLAILTARVLVGASEIEDSICVELQHSPLPRLPGMPGPSLLGFLAGASMVRRDAFLEVGGFPANSAIGGEEALVAVDLAARGWWICYGADLVVYHYPSLVRDAALRQVHEVRNALWFAWLRRPLRRAVWQTCSAAVAAIQHSDARRGLGLALVELPRMLRQRKVLPHDVEQNLRLLETYRRKGSRFPVQEGDVIPPLEEINVFSPRLEGRRLAPSDALSYLR
jgi:GT2 family glycosyltransferase